MSAPEPISPTTVSPPLRRSDGEAAREKLLYTALRLFSEQGFANTSIRHIAAAAGVNVAAIAYYFGDKQGLYRAVFQEPLGSPHDDIALFSNTELTLEQALRGLYVSFLAPLKQGEVAKQCIRLHYREMIEPTGMWQEEIDQGIAPYHAALVALLGKHLGLATHHPSLARLAISIVAQGVFSFMGQDVFARVAPTLFVGDAQIDEMAEHYIRCALAMVAAEQSRLGPRPHPTEQPPQTS